MEKKTENKKEEKLNLYQKIQRCRVELQNCNLKKSGKNKFANFEYYELADFLPKVNELFDKYKLFSQFTLKNDIATLEVFDTEEIDIEGKLNSVTFSSPTAEITIKGANSIQNLGGANTYMKRYLYLNLLEIVENEIFDISLTEGQNRKKTLTKGEEKEVLDLMQKMRELSDLTNTDYDKLLAYYKVKSNSEMTLEQLQDCVKNLETKQQKIEMLKESGQEVE